MLMPMSSARRVWAGAAVEHNREMPRRKTAQQALFMRSSTASCRKNCLRSIAEPCGIDANHNPFSFKNRIDVPRGS